MNIDEVQHRLWEQSQAHKQNREAGTPLFPTNPYDGRIRQPDGPDAQSRVDCGSL